MQEACWQRWPLQRDREARVYQEKRGGGGRATGRGGLVAAHIRAAALSAQAGRLIGAPLSRRRQGRGSSATIGQGVRTIQGEWSRTEACRRTTARLRALRSTCAAQCDGAAGHHEGKVWRRRRRALGWAQGVCRAGRTIGGSTFRRDGWEGPADGNEASAPKNCVARTKRYLGEFRTVLALSASPGRT